MRILFCVLAVTICNVSLAQDPTVPSDQILNRLRHEQPNQVIALPSKDPIIQEQLAPPVLKLKAVVMADSDHGTALIEVDGRRVRLRLSRRVTEQTDAPESAAATDIEFVVIQGSAYHVKGFSARSVLLTNNNQTLLVQ